jgi:short-subunit dehydrogenase
MTTNAAESTTAGRGAKTTALVTGASSGIGEAFARALASRSMNLLLTALPADEPLLETIAHDLSSKYGIRTAVVVMDLAVPGAASLLQSEADRLGFDPDLLVNSAGFGITGRFVDSRLEDQLRMVRVNVEALVSLVGLYLPRMVARGHGDIINVASTAALSPLPYFGVYAACKAFVLSFSNALWAEHRNQGIRVAAVCPGPVLTKFHERSATAPARHALETTAVVDAAFKALDRDRPAAVLRVMPFGIVFAALSSSIFPRRVRLLATERLAHWIFQRPH